MQKNILEKNQGKLTKKEIEILLKKGILGLYGSDEKNDFFEKNINEILK